MEESGVQVDGGLNSLREVCFPKMKFRKNLRSISTIPLLKWELSRWKSIADRNCILRLQSLHSLPHIELDTQTTASEWISSALRREQ